MRQVPLKQNPRPNPDKFRRGCRCLAMASLSIFAPASYNGRPPASVSPDSAKPPASASFADAGAADLFSTFHSHLLKESGEWVLPQ